MSERRETAHGIAEALTERANGYPDRSGLYWDGWRAAMVDAVDTATAHAVPPEDRARFDANLSAVVIGTTKGGPRGIMAALASEEEPTP